MPRSFATAIAALSLAAATAAGTAVTAGAAETRILIGYDSEMEHRHMIKRQIVETAKRTYGESAIYMNGPDLPAELDDRIVSGSFLPEGVSRPAPAELGPLPHHSVDVSRWVAVGEHLVEVAPTGEIVLVVRGVLP